jgi:serine/threonine-protein kinase
MTDRSASCDVDQLRLLLVGELPHQQELAATEHVASCRRCQQELESLAATPHWWVEVEMCLRQISRPAAEPATPSFAGDGPVLPDTCSADELAAEGASFAADFAVDFLGPSQLPGTLGKLGDIEIQEVIARGGMGVVLKGYQRELGRYVAVKVIAPHLAASGAARQRFAREARAAAAIVHAHVMAIHSVDSTGRLPYLVMPYLACESLQQRLDREGPLELKEILRIGRQTAAGLAAAHAQGLVHRDVKPANILLEKGVDRVMLTDFGLARAVDDASLTRSGVIAGTPQFMSPEQARGDVLDARTDLFSLGSVLYAMCTGRPPFRSETSFGVLRRITDSAARPIRDVNPEIPDWLCALVERLHAKEPSERLGSAAEISSLLEQCLAHVQQPAVVPLPDALQPEAGKLRTSIPAGKIGPAERLRPAWPWPIHTFPAAASILSTVAAVAMVAVLLAVFAARRPLQESSGVTAGVVPSAAKESLGDQTTTPHRVPTWDDGANTLMLELSADVDTLEARAGRVWDEIETDPSQENRP